MCAPAAEKTNVVAFAFEQAKDLNILHSSCRMVYGDAMIVELSKGRQITIPAKIREAFHLDAGSKVEIVKRENEIVLKIMGDELESLFRNAKNIKPKHKLSAKQMDELNERLLR